MPDPIPAEAARPFRVLVTGSRRWDDEGVIHLALSELLFQHKTIVLVHGDCSRGADRIADQWAAFRNAGEWTPVLVERHPADWNGPAGRGAGYARNAEMIALGADLVLAFIVDASRGASHAADLAEKAGIPVRRYERSSRA
ncbi:DUF2493 domain-containing protein (plasmid) [Nonomuraea sp. CA-143628]|uniref:DUF2493 domain-containing protein n=1 Tax=Nonomuraea sp. CA-143628 TaxID=3239997 RepID=UPI003D8E1B18